MKFNRSQVQNEVGKRIAACRTDWLKNLPGREFTQAELAASITTCRVSKSMISRLENGWFPAKLATLQAICESLGLDVIELHLEVVEYLAQREMETQGWKYPAWTGK